MTSTCHCHQTKASQLIYINDIDSDNFGWGSGRIQVSSTFLNPRKLWLSAKCWAFNIYPQNICYMFVWDLPSRGMECVFTILKTPILEMYSWLHVSLLYRHSEFGMGTAFHTLNILVLIEENKLTWTYLLALRDEKSSIQVQYSISTLFWRMEGAGSFGCVCVYDTSWTWICSCQNWTALIHTHLPNWLKFATRCVRVAFLWRNLMPFVWISFIWIEW